MAKLIRALTRKKRGPKKQGLIQALNNALHENDQSFSAKQGAGSIGMMMMLRAKRLGKWLEWLKRRRLRLKRRLKNLEALENLLREEMALAKECGMAFQFITAPKEKQAADREQAHSLNAEEIEALLASFSESRPKHLAGSENPPPSLKLGRGDPLLAKGAKRRHHPQAKRQG
jgi:hypothetical protein